MMDIQQNLSDMITEYEETHDDEEDAFLLDKDTVVKLLTESDIPEEKVNRIEKSIDEVFGDKPPVAEHVIDAKALAQNAIRLEKIGLEDQVGVLTKTLDEKNTQLEEKNTQLEERTQQLIEKQEEIDNYIAETKTYDVVLRVKPEKASQISSQTINGQKCLVIPMAENEHATINGVNTTV